MNIKGLVQVFLSPKILKSIRLSNKISRNIDTKLLDLS